MSAYPTNMDDVIGSRDVIERIEELEAMGDEIEKEEAEELRTLRELADEAASYSEDWDDGTTLIRDSYFVTYARDMVKDIRDISHDLPSYIVIDWDETAAAIQYDYASVDFDGVTYWIRC